MDKLVNPAEPFPRQLSKNLWVLGNYYFNLYLIAGDESSALIEMGVSATVDEVINQLKLLNTKPDYLILTHPHADHLTGLPGLKNAFPKAALIMAEGAGDFIAHPKAREAFVSDDCFVSGALKDLGYVPRRQPIKEIGDITPDLIVAEDIEIDLGNQTFRCLPSEGHSPGSLMVHIPDRRAVLASDSLGFHFNGRCLLPLYFTGFEPYMKTLEQIMSLHPEIIGLAHQSPFAGKTAEIALTEALRSAPALFNRIRESRKSDEAMADELFQENYRDEFTIYTPENILNCCKLLVKRSRYPL